MRPTHDAAAVAVGHPRVSVRGAAGPAAPRPDPTPPPFRLPLIPCATLTSGGGRHQDAPPPLPPWGPAWRGRRAVGPPSPSHFPDTFRAPPPPLTSPPAPPPSTGHIQIWGGGWGTVSRRSFAPPRVRAAGWWWDVVKGWSGQVRSGSPGRGWWGRGGPGRAPGWPPPLAHGHMAADVEGGSARGVRGTGKGGGGGSGGADACAHRLGGAFVGWGWGWGWGGKGGGDG